jgi:hypothetical protein
MKFKRPFLAQLQASLNEDWFTEALLEQWFMSPSVFAETKILTAH